ncbi:uncharacterized protein HD556DRAFT_1403921 [Suillus plorans]|uniref:Chorismate mutase domain-containing protein n=1 Tax=Suillus plorans TaxID=116603 RepID=A0A9P7DDG1_9AGAM|nr:uncharacterized protein HD556DRAFT_1403921 [Suillus plorans]KAG1788318.1 hypothetical protein HD556DRAFT_1403921 [Suillus plorans]
MAGFLVALRIIGLVPTIQFANGTTCCSSLDEIRVQLDIVDTQLLQLLSTRASYVREATRSKATVSDVNVPSRNEQVIQGAVDNAPSVHLPQIVAKTVYEGIINSSAILEECIVIQKAYAGNHQPV